MKIELTIYSVSITTQIHVWQHLTPYVLQRLDDVFVLNAAHYDFERRSY